MLYLHMVDIFGLTHELIISFQKLYVTFFVLAGRSEIVRKEGSLQFYGYS